MSNATTCNILSKRSIYTIVFETCTVVIIIVVALSGNLMVCAAVWRNSRLRTGCNYLIVSLAATDIVTSAFSFSISACFVITGHMVFPGWVCQAQAYLFLTLGMLSVSTMSETAVHRYVTVVHPRHSPRKKTVLKIIIATWVFMFLVPLPYFVDGNTAVFYPKDLYCFINMKNVDKAVAIATLVGLSLNLVFISFCYGRVLATVRTHKQNTKMTLQSGSRNQGRLSPEEGRVTGILVAVVLGFVFCWVPVYCVWMLNLYEITMPRLVHKFAALFAALSSCINPIIYGVLNRELRAEFKKILPCKQLACQCISRNKNIVHPT